MNRPEKIYLDANIFIFAYERAPAEKNGILEIIAAAGRSNVPLLATSELVLSELLVLPLRLGDSLRAATYRQTIVRSAWLDVCPVHRQVLLSAAALRARHRTVKLPDAIHVATALITGCSHVLTADEGLKGVYSFSDDDASTRTVSVIRPDEPTLASLLKSLVS